MADVNFEELFGNFTAADALEATRGEKKKFSGNPDVYAPSIKDEKCKDMNYRALIRLIPFYHEGKFRTIISRWESYLKDVNGENGMFVVSPKTIGKKCPIKTLSWQLYNSSNALQKANSKKLQVYQQFYCLGEVVKDAQHPEHEGKIVIYKFGSNVHDIIEGSMNSTEYEDGINPFALYNARLFEINLKKDATKKMENGSPVTDYKGCRFIERTSPIHFTVKDELDPENTDGIKMTLTNEIETQKAFIKWLDEEAPKIKDYFWKDWTTETMEKVNTILATYTSEYEAPRSSTTKVKESVKNASETEENVSTKVKVETKPEPEVETEIPEDEPETSGDDESWIQSILG